MARQFGGGWSVGARFAARADRRRAQLDRGRHELVAPLCGRRIRRQFQPALVTQLLAQPAEELLTLQTG